MDNKREFFVTTINSILSEGARPALTRSLFNPVINISDGSSRVSFFKQGDKAITGGWTGVGLGNLYDRFHSEMIEDSNKVVQRKIMVEMELLEFDRLNSGEGVGIAFNTKTLNMFNSVEVEIDKLSFLGGGGLRGITNAGYYKVSDSLSVTNMALKGVSLTGQLTSLASKTYDDLVKAFSKAFELSEAKGRYLEPKTLLLGTNVHNALTASMRDKNDLSVKTYLEQNFNIEKIVKVRDLHGKALVLENNPSYLQAWFGKDMSLDGNLEELAGGVTGYYSCRYGGVLVKNAEPMVLIA